MTSTEEPLRPDGHGVLRRLQVWQAIERRWSHALDLHERMLLLRICDMTVGWGDLFLDASLSQIVDGDGDRMGPIGFRIRTAETALSSLRARGLVSTEHLKRGKSVIGMRFTPNTDLILAEWEGNVAPTIREPKRLKNQKNEEGSRISCGEVPHDVRGGAASGAGGFRTTCGVSKGTIKQHQGNSNSRPSPPAPATEEIFGFSDFDRTEEQTSPPVRNSKSVPDEKSAAEKIEDITTRNAARRKTDLVLAMERVSAALPWVKGEKAEGALRNSDLELVWSQTFAEALPHAGVPMAWTKAERGMARTVFSRWSVKQDGSKPNGEFADFLVWSITNWKETCTKEFGWMTERKPPEHPSVGFWVRFADNFENAWLTRKRKKLLDRLDLEEVEELRIKGFTYEAALEVVARRKISKLLRKEGGSQSAPSKPQPYVRPRQAPQVQPVATDKVLSPSAMSPTDVARQKRMAKGWAAASAIFDTPPEVTE